MGYWHGAGNGSPTLTSFALLGPISGMENMRQATREGAPRRASRTISHTARSPRFTKAKPPPRSRSPHPGSRFRMRDSRTLLTVPGPLSRDHPGTNRFELVQRHGNVAWSNAGNDNAFFTTGAGIVNVTDNITARSITFSITGFTLNGANTITLVNAGRAGQRPRDWRQHQRHHRNRHDQYAARRRSQMA
jgi:hypothetical protein